MFGSKKIQELEAQLRQAQEQLSQETAEKTSLAQSLEEANRRIADLEARLDDFDLARLKEEARATQAEYEGLRQLYATKNREFDDAREEAEQSFAREAALKRHNLENEIRDNRQANQDYVTRTVRSFGESYNYYLNQIRVLMDALGDVASRTGEALFSGENGDLKSHFGSMMRSALKSGADTLKGDAGDVVLIAGSDEAEEPVEEAIDALDDAVEEAAEAAEEAAEDFAEE